MLPGLKMFAGIIPSLHSPGVIIPGVFGPIIVTFNFVAYAIMFIASFIGKCSVTTTIVLLLFVTASRTASWVSSLESRSLSQQCPEQHRHNGLFRQER